MSIGWYKPVQLFLLDFFKSFKQPFQNSLSLNKYCFTFRKQILSTLMLLCTTGTSGYKSLMRKIPNAAYVMNPCDQAEPWEGIGHLAPAGYGDRNKFGHDFKQHGMVLYLTLSLEL